MVRAPAWLRALGLIGLGVVAGLGQAPLGWHGATVLALAVWFWLQTRAPGSRRAAWQGWLIGLGYFGFTLRWIESPFMVDAARDGWMAPFGIALMAGGAALFWAAAAGLAQRLAPRSGAALAVGLAGVELTRSLILTGFPWALLGHVWVDTPLASLAAYGGPHLLTCLTVALGWSLLPLARRHPAGLAGPALALGLGFLVAPGAAPVPAADAPVVRLVQPNAPQDQKWDPLRNALFFERMLAATQADPRPDLIVWPETAIPVLLDYAQPSFDIMAEAAAGVPIIVGLNRNVGAIYHNSLVVLGRGGVVQALYDKQHLVPFGEYIPGGEWLAAYGITGFAASEGGGFTPGTTGGIISLDRIGPVRALICYEGIFAEEIGTGDIRPRLMVLITNDAWFGKGAGPAQHLAQARLRAIEQGLPMVRVANTGISAMIDGRGRVLGQLALDTTGHLDASLPPALPATAYIRFGDAPVGVAIILTLLAAIVGTRRNHG